MFRWCYSWATGVFTYRIISSNKLNLWVPPQDDFFRKWLSAYANFHIRMIPLQKRYINLWVLRNFVKMWLLTSGCVWFLVPTSIISKGHGLFSLEHCWSRGAEPRIFHQSTTWECRGDVSFVTTLSTLRMSSSWVCYMNQSQSWCSRFCSVIFQQLGCLLSDQNLSKWWCVFFGPQQKQASHSRQRTTVLLRFHSFWCFCCQSH